VLKEFLKSKLYILTGNAIYKREFLLRNNLRYTPGCVYGEDLEFIVKAILMSERSMYIPELLVFYVLRESSATQDVGTYTIRNRFENLYGVYKRVYSFIDSLTNDKNLLKLWQGRIGFDFLSFLKSAVVYGEWIDSDDKLSTYLGIAKRARSKTLKRIIVKGMLNVLPQEFVMKTLYWYGSLRRKNNE